MAVLLLAGPVYGCGRRSAARTAAAATRVNPGDEFVDVTEKAGVRFQHVNGVTGQMYYPEMFGSGAAFIDYDRDGWPDILLINGDQLPESAPSQPPGSRHTSVALYHNNHDGTFTDVTEKAGLAIPLYGMGVAVGDYDNDGYDDIYVSGLDHGLLLHNERNGTFRDVTREAGVGNEGHWGTSCAWVDYDRDGRLDLFVCNYVRWDPRREQVCRSGDLRIYCGPLVYEGDSCRLFHNQGNGKFADVTRTAGIYKTSGKSLGVAVWDFDGSGYPDIAVSNDLSPNYLFHNLRNGRFKDVGTESGFAFGSDGTARSGMGIDVADTLDDGRSAVFVSDFAREPFSFYTQWNRGSLQFSDRVYESGIGEPSLLPLGFGLFFFDYDNDGWKDAFVANGHIQPDIARYEAGQTFAQRPLLFHNRRDGTFEEVAAQAGKAMNQPLVGRGAACGDFDNDGRPDILISCNGGPAHLLHNENRTGNTWLTIKLVGRKSNRDGIGAEVSVSAGGRTQRDQVRSGSSYLSASDLRLHFGLGSARQADSVEVRWPSGLTDEIRAVPANQILEIVEGSHKTAQPQGFGNGAVR